MTLNFLAMMFFGYLLVNTDYTLKARWIYYMDGLVFAVNFAIVFLYITDKLGVYYE
jgi:hypothetical protein